jgi:hypothetical protein
VWGRPATEEIVNLSFLNAAIQQQRVRDFLALVERNMPDRDWQVEFVGAMSEVVLGEPLNGSLDAAAVYRLLTAPISCWQQASDRLAQMVGQQDAEEVAMPLDQIAADVGKILTKVDLLPAGGLLVFVMTDSIHLESYRSKIEVALIEAGRNYIWDKHELVVIDNQYSVMLIAEGSIHLKRYVAQADQVMWPPIVQTQ